MTEEAGSVFGHGEAGTTIGHGEAAGFAGRNFNLAFIFLTQA
jgi:hypothetical protein